VVVQLNGISELRLARIQADDSLVQKSGFIAGSPVVLHNISSEISPISSSLVTIQAGPFGAHRPTLPTASSVTVARVASPFSTNRIYQSLFLEALKEYFGHATRLVKQGDIIVVGINTDDIRRVQNTVEESETSEAFNYESFDSAPRTNEVIFFIVTDVEAPSNAASGINGFGCWVDPKITRVAQTGVQNSRVPDLGSYLGPGKSAGFLGLNIH
jgi:peroxin-6